MRAATVQAKRKATFGVGAACRCVLTVLLTFGASPCAQSTTVGVIRIDGPIGPAVTDYTERALQLAGERGFECLVIELDTPGGLLDSTKTIVQQFFAAPVPVVVFVAPAGAHAASAGCFITLAADVAAMAPSTSIGAAHPVSIGGVRGGSHDEVMKEKVENFAASFIESIAAKRERNVAWAVQSVRESAALPAERALALNVIEIIAADRAALLTQLDGREVRGRALRTAGVSIEEIPMAVGERLFHWFWRPEVLFILMLVAVYGIIGELSNPGAIIPGTVGLIALVVALYMMAVLPVTIAGIILLVLALVLFVLEIFTPTFGLLTAAGIAAFVLGGIMLFDRAMPAFRLSLGFIIPTALVTAAFFVFVVAAGLRAQWRPSRLGPGTLIGQTTTVAQRIDAHHGWVRVEGENWQAASEVPIDPGQQVIITGLEGLTLKVKPVS